MSCKYFTQRQCVSVALRCSPKPCVMSGILTSLRHTMIQAQGLTHTRAKARPTLSGLFTLHVVIPPAEAHL